MRDVAAFESSEPVNDQPKVTEAVGWEGSWGLRDDFLCMVNLLFRYMKEKAQPLYQVSFVAGPCG